MTSCAARLTKSCLPMRNRQIPLNFNRAQGGLRRNKSVTCCNRQSGAYAQRDRRGRLGVSNERRVMKLTAISNVIAALETAGCLGYAEHAAEFAPCRRSGGVEVMKPGIPALAFGPFGPYMRASCTPLAHYGRACTMKRVRARWTLASARATKTPALHSLPDRESENEKRHDRRSALYDGSAAHVPAKRRIATVAMPHGAVSATTRR